SAAAEDVDKWQSRVDVAESSHLEAEAELERANLNYHAQIDGVNTAVADNEAQLAQAKYYLDNTTLVAPEDGRIINLQVRPGMVSGIYRIGGIAALIADDDRYLLATFYQENLKYVRPGQPVEVAFDLYPGQIFAGKVDSIWRANGVGQYLPSDEIPKFQQPPPTVPQGQYAAIVRRLRRATLSSRSSGWVMSATRSVRRSLSVRAVISQNRLLTSTKRPKMPANRSSLAR